MLQFRNSMLTLFFTVMAVSAHAAPIIKFYNKQGVNDCTFTMYNGSINFKSSNNNCKNDNEYSFSIEDARDGMSFSIQDAPSCNNSEPWARYKINQDHVAIPLTSVDAAYNLKPGQVIKPGLVADGHKNTNQLYGKVSCVAMSNIPD